MDLKKMNKVFQSLGEGIIVHRRDSSIAYFNEAAAQILDLEESEIKDRSPSDPEWYVVDENSNPVGPTEVPVGVVLRTGKSVKGVILGVVHRRKKITTWIQASGVPILDDDGEIDMVVVSFANITALREAQDLVHQRTYNDLITDLPNALSLRKFLEGTETDYGYLLLQIINFDQLSQFFGMEKSEEILLFFVGKIEGWIGSKDRLFHVSRTNFMILLSPDDGEFTQRIGNIAEQIKKLYYESLGAYLLVKGGFSPPGLAGYPGAQIALSNAVGQENDILTYHPKMSPEEQLKKEIFWIGALKDRGTSVKVVPVYQPIVETNTGSIHKYEVLMRIKIGEELFTPYHFLGVAKKYNLYKSLTLNLLDVVLDFFRTRNVSFSINLSTQDLTDQDSCDYLLSKVKAFPYPENITVEIVESESIMDFEAINRILSLMKVHGVKVAIDDFGSGYSNFEYILRLEADFIKIDGSLVRDIDKNKNSYDIVRAIVGFAQSKGIKTIAEFVSSKEINEKLKEIGVDFSQGYHWGKPELDLLEGDRSEKNHSHQVYENNQELRQLIYSSRLSKGGTMSSLSKMFHHARNNNQRDKITGFILFDGDYFLQVIEGTTKKIEDLFQRIFNNPLHTDIQLLGRRVLEERDFDQWDLGFYDDKLMINSTLEKSTKEKAFLPFQFGYDTALDILKHFSKAFQ